jgi:hypothetical protein
VQEGVNQGCFSVVYMGDNGDIPNIVAPRRAVLQNTPP